MSFFKDLLSHSHIFIDTDRDRDKDKDKEYFDTQVHTIYIIIGPSNCGKTTFINNYAIPKLRSKGNFNIQNISADDICHDLLGYPYEKNDPLMLECTSMAYGILINKLNTVTSYPINAEFIFIDTNGLSSDLRREVIEIAYQNNYTVEIIIFNYMELSLYFANDSDFYLVQKHLKSLNQDVIPTLNNYKKVHTVYDQEFNKYDFNIVDLNYYQKHILPKEFTYVIIGDVHECVDELKELIISNGFQIINNKINFDNTDKRIILIGNLIDLGNKTRELIDFIHLNIDDLFLIKGKHEEYVYDVLQGIKVKIDHKIIDKYYTSINFFDTNQDYKDKFFEIYKKMMIFYIFNGSETNKRSFIVTHAPCHQKYLGKLDNISLKKQINFNISNIKKFDDEISFLREESRQNYPYHIFGNLPMMEILIINNKISLSTGCINGNKLSSIELGSERYYIRSQKFLNMQPIVIDGELFEVVTHVDINELSIEDKKRVDKIVEDKINYIMIEPINRVGKYGLVDAIEYYRVKDVKEIILIPKYVGMECQVYLFREIHKCYIVNGKGYRIEDLDMAQVYINLYKHFGRIFREMFIKIEMIIVDGTLIGQKEFEYKPTTILKIRYTNGLEVLPNSGEELEGDIFGKMKQADIYKLVSDDIEEAHIVEIDKIDYQALDKYYDSLGEEIKGILVRPDYVKNYAWSYEIDISDSEDVEMFYDISMKKYDLSRKMLKYDIKKLDEFNYRQIVADMLFT